MMHYRRFGWRAGDTGEHRLVFRQIPPIEKSPESRAQEVLDELTADTLDAQQQERLSQTLTTESPVYQALLVESQKRDESQRHIINQNLLHLRELMDQRMEGKAERVEVLGRIDRLQRVIVSAATPETATPPAAALPEVAPEAAITPASPSAPKRWFENSVDWAKEKGKVAWEWTKQTSGKTRTWMEAHPNLTIAIGSTLGVGLLYGLWKWWNGRGTKGSETGPSQPTEKKESAFLRVVRWVPFVGLLAVMGYGGYSAYEWWKKFRNDPLGVRNSPVTRGALGLAETVGGGLAGAAKEIWSNIPDRLKNKISQGTHTYNVLTGRESYTGNIDVDCILALAADGLGEFLLVGGLGYLFNSTYGLVWELPGRLVHGLERAFIAGQWGEGFKEFGKAYIAGGIVYFTSIAAVEKWLLGRPDSAMMSSVNWVYEMYAKVPGVRGFLDKRVGVALQAADRKVWPVLKKLGFQEAGQFREIRGQSAYFSFESRSHRSLHKTALGSSASESLAAELLRDCNQWDNIVLKLEDPDVSTLQKYLKRWDAQRILSSSKSKRAEALDELRRVLKQLGESGAKRPTWVPQGLWQQAMSDVDFNSKYAITQVREAISRLPSVAPAAAPGVPPPAPAATPPIPAPPPSPSPTPPASPVPPQSPGAPAAPASGPSPASAPSPTAPASQPLPQQAPTQPAPSPSQAAGPSSLPEKQPTQPSTTAAETPPSKLTPADRGVKPNVPAGEGAEALDGQPEGVKQAARQKAAAEMAEQAAETIDSLKKQVRAAQQAGDHAEVARLLQAHRAALKTAEQTDEEARALLRALEGAEKVQLKWTKFVGPGLTGLGIIVDVLLVTMNEWELAHARQEGNAGLAAVLVKKRQSLVGAGAGGIVWGGGAYGLTAALGAETAHASIPLLTMGTATAPGWLTAGVLAAPVIWAGFRSEAIFDAVKEWEKSERAYLAEDGAALLSTLRKKETERSAGHGAAYGDTWFQNQWKKWTWSKPAYEEYYQKMYERSEHINRNMREKIYSAYFLQYTQPLLFSGDMTRVIERAQVLAQGNTDPEQQKKFFQQALGEIARPRIQEAVRAKLQFLRDVAGVDFIGVSPLVLSHADAYAALVQLKRQSEREGKPPRFAYRMPNGEERVLDLAEFGSQGNQLSQEKRSAIQRVVQEYHERAQVTELYQKHFQQSALREAARNPQELQAAEAQLRQNVRADVLLRMRHAILRAEQQLRDSVFPEEKKDVVRMQFHREFEEKFSAFLALLADPACTGEQYAGALRGLETLWEERPEEMYRRNTSALKDVIEHPPAPVVDLYGGTDTFGPAIRHAKRALPAHELAGLEHLLDAVDAAEQEGPSA